MENQAYTLLNVGEFGIIREIAIRECGEGQTMERTLQVKWDRGGVRRHS